MKTDNGVIRVFTVLLCLGISGCTTGQKTTPVVTESPVVTETQTITETQSPETTAPLSSEKNIWINTGLAANFLSNIAIDPINSLKIYVNAENNGPLFKSTDGGKTWGDPIDAGDCAIQIDPKTPTTIYTGDLNDGIFKSLDGGGTWAQIIDGFSGTTDSGKVYIPKGACAIGLKPEEPSTVFVGTDVGVYRSFDGGKTWESNNYGLTNIADTGFIWISSIDSLVVDPKTPSTIYVSSFGTVYKGELNGQPWNTLLKLDTDPTKSTLAIDPLNPDNLYFGGKKFLRFSSTGGRTWSDLLDPAFSELYIRSIVIDPQNSSIIYLGTSGGVFKSIDQGQSWNSLDTGLPNPAVTTLVIDPTNPSTLYAIVPTDDVAEFGLFVNYQE